MSLGEVIAHVLEAEHRCLNREVDTSFLTGSRDKAP